MIECMTSDENCIPEAGMGDDQIVENFLAGYHRPNTVRNYGQALSRFREFLGTKRLGEASWHDMELFKAALLRGDGQRRPLSPSAIASLISPIRSFYKWGSGANIALFATNPAAGIRLPKVPVTSSHHYLTRRELEAMLNHLKSANTRGWMMALYMVILGLRVSELIGMKWKDFVTDPAETCIWLNVTNGKGGKVRQVKVPAALWELHCDPEIRKQLLKNPASGAGDRVFPISSRQVERIIMNACEACGIAKKATPHWLRHTNATLALLNGASIQQVQHSLGHTQINTTQRYMHTVELMKKAAPDFVADSMAHLLDPALF